MKNVPLNTFSAISFTLNANRGSGLGTTAVKTGISPGGGLGEPTTPNETFVRSDSSNLNLVYSPKDFVRGQSGSSSQNSSPHPVGTRPMYFDQRAMVLGASTSASSAPPKREEVGLTSQDLAKTTAKWAQEGRGHVDFRDVAEEFGGLRQLPNNQLELSGAKFHRAEVQELVEQMPSRLMRSPKFAGQDLEKGLDDMFSRASLIRKNNPGADIKQIQRELTRHS